MSKKFRNELEAMTADQVTEKLGDFCEQLGRIKTDKTTGTVKTFFNKAVYMFKGNLGTLMDVAARKNDADLKNCRGPEQELMEIAVASKARNSQSADKIWKYLKLWVDATKSAKDANNGVTVNPLKRQKMIMKAYKKLG